MDQTHVEEFREVGGGLRRAAGVSPYVFLVTLAALGVLYALRSAAVVSADVENYALLGASSVLALTFLIVVIYMVRSVVTEHRRQLVQRQTIAQDHARSTEKMKLAKQRTGFNDAAPSA
jgi:hypothetical protein